MTAFFSESWAVSVVTGVVAFAVYAFEDGGVSGAGVSFVVVSASAAIRCVRFAVVAFVTKALTTQASDGFFLWLVGDYSSV